MVYENRTESASWCITILCVHPCLFSFFFQLARKGMHQRRGMHRATVESAPFGYTCGGVDPQSMMEQMEFPRQKNCCHIALMTLHTLYMPQTQLTAHPPAPKGAQQYHASPPLASSNLHRFPIRKVHRGEGADRFQSQIVSLFGHFCAPQR